MIKIFEIKTGLFKLDGGAMFGVVPKSLWNKLNPADENNMCTWAMRCLLIVSDNKKILIDTGMGTKQDQKFFSHYFLHGNDDLIKSLANINIKAEEITDVIHTHLHFDHCGGSIYKDTLTNEFKLTFANANYWTNKQHWHLATNPNDREKASFLKENILPMEALGKLKFVDDVLNIIPELSFISVNGHTAGMMLPVINFNGQEIIFMADLLPSTNHIPIAWVMAYDTQPLLSLQEKKETLTRAAKNNSILYFEHDHQNQACTVHHTEKGIRLKNILKLKKQQFEIIQ